MNEEAMNLLFRNARSYNRWSSAGISEAEIRAVFDLMKWGPTSANCSPARFVFVQSPAAKLKLAACVADNNRVKVEQAPLTVIIGMDENFQDTLPFLFPHVPDARSWFANPEARYATAFRNSSLQGAYFMLAARLAGLDCGPMSGFDNAKLDAAFFSNTSVKSNFICALGHGTQEMLYPRLPRFNFDDVCSFS